MGPEVTRRVQSNQYEDGGVEGNAGGVVGSTGAVKVDVGAAAAAEGSRSEKGSSMDAAAKRGDEAMRARTDKSITAVSGSRGRGRVDVERERVAHAALPACTRSGSLFASLSSRSGTEAGNPASKFI
jgi:hypothetical protein